MEQAVAVWEFISAVGAMGNADSSSFCQCCCWASASRGRGSGASHSAPRAGVGRHRCAKSRCAAKLGVRPSDTSALQKVFFNGQGQKQGHASG
jgi:hypothetical protein